MSIQLAGVSSFALLLSVLLLVSTDMQASSSRKALDQQQVDLDKRCEEAREAILSVERARYVEECVQDRSRRSRAECERFYADHGDATAARGPLYMDLPECAEAHEFRQNRPRR